MTQKKLSLSLFFLLISLLSFSSCSSFKDVVKGEERKTKYFRAAWQKNLDPNYESGNLPISFHSPELDQGLLFIGSADGVMYAYNAANGKMIWQEKENSGISNKATVFERLLLYGTVEGRLIARDRLTGELVYSIELGDALEAPVTIDGGRAFVNLRDHKIAVLDAVTGKILWVYRRSVSQGTTVQEVAKPVVYQNKLFVGFADGSIVAFTIEEGKILWDLNIAEDTKFVDVNMQPAFQGNLMYVGSLAGPLTIINIRSGEILRRYPFRSSRAPLFVGEDIYVGTQEGQVLILNKNGEVKQSKSVDSGVFGLSIWKDKLAVATRKGTLHLFELETLKEIEQFSLGHYYSTVFGELTTDEENLAILSARNRLYVFKPL